MGEHDRAHCEEVVAHLLEYLDGEMDASRRERIARHLAECRGCYSRAEFEQALRERLRTLSSPAPSPSLRGRIRALLDDF